MAKRYAIARLLPVEGRRVAVEAEYEPMWITGEHQALRSDGWCPLGLALRDIDPYISESPASDQVAEVIAVDAPLPRYERVMAAARHFICDWDSGRITPADLPAIFEVD
jgi:hypothetical protein